MTLLGETLAISLCMMGLATLALFSSAVRRRAHFFFLLGTGALTGILLFDLLPDLFTMGGSSSLWGVAFVWGIYSLFHLSHLGHHKPAGDAEVQPTSTLFLIAMIAHGLASGMLLVASQNLGQKFGHTVFLALLAHKAYEVLTVSSILIERQSSRASGIFFVCLYSLSLPAGVLLTFLFRSTLTPSVALIATSLAAGTLLGCLIYDFLLPSLSHLRLRRRDAFWILAGLLATRILITQL